MKKKELTCKETEKMIPAFLTRKMKGRDVERFTEHIANCSSCKEELTIEYLTSEGLIHLEKGTSFNLGKELGDFIEDAVIARRVRVRLRMAMVIYEAAAILIISTIWLYMLT